jgi:hypothetical protein
VIRSYRPEVFSCFSTYEYSAAATCAFTEALLEVKGSAIKLCWAKLLALMATFNGRNKKLLGIPLHSGRESNILDTQK